MSKQDDGSYVEFSVQWRPRGGDEEWQNPYPPVELGSLEEAKDRMASWSSDEVAQRYTEYRIVKRRITNWQPVKVKS